MMPRVGLFETNQLRLTPAIRYAVMHLSIKHPKGSCGASTRLTRFFQYALRPELS